MVLIRHGDTSGFELRDIALPAMQPGHMLVRVMATSVNPVDCKLRRQGSVAAPMLPAVLGADFAGRIEALAPDVRGFATGEEVYGCAGGLRRMAGGALAEFLLADARLVAHKPRSLGFRLAAALPLVALTAWEGLERSGVGAGDQVLVRGGAGGVGHCAVQLAKVRGAHVTATASSAERAAIVRGLGADAVLEIGRDAGPEAAFGLSGGRGYDVVFDATGNNDSDWAASAARLNGQVVAIVGRGQHDFGPYFSRGLTVHLVNVLIPMLHDFGREHHGRMLAEIATLVDAGRLRPLLDPRQFRLEQTAEAHACVESGAAGKIVVELA